MFGSRLVLNLGVLLVEHYKYLLVVESAAKLRMQSLAGDLFQKIWGRNPGTYPSAQHGWGSINDGALP